jgi:hypothetical protein
VERLSGSVSDDKSSDLPHPGDRKRIHPDAGIVGRRGKTQAGEMELALRATLISDGPASFLAVAIRTGQKKLAVQGYNRKPAVFLPDHLTHAFGA